MLVQSFIMNSILYDLKSCVTNFSICFPTAYIIKYIRLLMLLGCDSLLVDE